MVDVIIAGFCAKLYVCALINLCLIETLWLLKSAAMHIPNRFGQV